MRLRLTWLLIAILAAIPALAEPELITDRPDQTESAAVVPPGSVQIEAGWTLAHDGEAGVEFETDAVPGTLVRIGLADKVELRVGWTGMVAEEIDDGALVIDDDGSGDTNLGAKFRLRDEQGRSPDIALLVGTSLPTGDDKFSTGRADPSIRLSMAHTLTDRMGLGYNVGLDLGTRRKASGDRDTEASFIYTTSLGVGITDRLGAFVELFGDIPSSAGGGPTHSADAGLTWQLRDNLQLDVAGGVGANDRADDWFVGVGVSARLPR